MLPKLVVLEGPERTAVAGPAREHPHLLEKVRLLLCHTNFEPDAAKTFYLNTALLLHLHKLQMQEGPGLIAIAWPARNRPHPFEK